MCSPFDNDRYDGIILAATAPVVDIELARLRKFIEDHGVNAWLDGTKLMAEDEAVINGSALMEVVEIEPNMEAVHAWLGY